MSAETTAGWAPATLVWLERKSSDQDGAIYEVIFELESDPDLLRQANVHEANLDPHARRREPILVHEHDGDTHIRSAAGREV